MMISLVAKTNTWHDRQLVKEAKKKGLALKKVDLADFNRLADFINNAGDIILWRSSSLGASVKRAIILNILRRRGKLIINEGLVDHPEVACKSFQQKLVENSLRDVLSIPTFVFRSREDLLKAISNKELRFPFIKKPDLGAQGKEVMLINNQKEVEQLEEDVIQESVFQNYMKNDGDFRVLVVGGRPLGIIKRIARQGSFLNNISQGGEACDVKEEKLRVDLSRKAAKVAALFNLGLCGVDLILNKEDQQLYFLEVNTVPQWQGFQKATKINVAEEIISYCKSLSERRHKPETVLVQNYYKNARILVDDKKFHFYSRLYLWTKDEKYKKELDDLKSYFIGGEDQQKQEKKIKEFLEDKDTFRLKALNNREFRKKVLKGKLSFLGVYCELLFRSLLAKHIFKIDIYNNVVIKYVSEKKFLEVAEELLENKNKTRLLSTFAVNYLYFLSYFLKEESFRNRAMKVIMSLAEEIKESRRDNEFLRNDFYFLTHCLIGESGFYHHKIKRNEDFYRKVIKKLERMVAINYFNLSLDNKLEFLICCKLIEYNSFLEEIIAQEAEKSFSPIGNFLVDRLNGYGIKASGKDFFSSEHRNVLYLLSKLNLD